MDEKRNHLPGAPGREIARGVSEITGINRGTITRYFQSEKSRGEKRAASAAGADSLPPAGRYRRIDMPSLPQLEMARGYGRRRIRFVRRRRYRRARSRTMRVNRYKRVSKAITKLSKACDPVLSAPFPGQGVVPATAIPALTLNAQQIVNAQQVTGTKFDNMVGGFQLPTTAASGLPIQLAVVSADDMQGRDDLCVQPHSFRFLINLLWPYTAATPWRGSVPIPVRLELWVVKASASTSLCTSAVGIQNDYGYCDAYRVKDIFRLTSDTTFGFGMRERIKDYFLASVKQTTVPPTWGGLNTELRSVMSVVKRKIWRNVVPYGYSKANQPWNTQSSDFNDKTKSISFTLKLKKQEMNFKTGAGGNNYPYGNKAQYYAFICAAMERDAAGVNDNYGVSLPIVTAWSVFRFRQ